MRRISATTKLTLAAMSTALSVLCLYAASVLPTMRLALMFLSSLAIWIPLNERKGIVYALLAYLATGAVAFLIIPEKIYSVAYMLFFGIYGFLKLGIDSAISDKFIAFILRIIICNILTGLAIFLVGLLLETDIFTLIPEVSLWIIIAVIEIAFIAYELIYTLCIRAFDENLRKVLLNRR